MKILVCGCRNWNKLGVIRDRFISLPPDSTIIHGGCTGADTLAGQVAESLGMKIQVFPAEWKLHGRSAGPRRNQKMLDEGEPELVIAFHPDIRNSRGTKDMVNRAEKTGIPVEIITGSVQNTTQS